MHKTHIYSAGALWYNRQVNDEMVEGDCMRTQDMTQGHPLKLILAFSLPLMLGNAFQQMYTMVDTIVVGQGIGVAALAALGASDWLHWLVLSLIQGMAQGFSIKMAQDFGARDEAELRRTVGGSVLLAAIVAVATAVVSLACMRPVLLLMNTPEDILGTAIAYISVIFAGMPIVMAYNLAAAILRAVGDSRSPLYAMVIASLLNVALDLLFVLVFHWGVRGAALATVLAQLVAATYCLFAIRRLPMLHLSRDDVRQGWKLGGLLMRLGSPMAFQNVLISIGGMIVQSVVNGFGVLFIAGFTATNKLYGLLEIAATSFGYAMVTYAGQNLGAKRYERIRRGVKSGLALGLVVAVIIGAAMLLGGRAILSLFISGTPEEVEATLAVAYRYLSIMSCFLPVLYVLHVLRSNIQGLGDTVLPMVSGMAEFAMRVLSALALPLLVGSDGIFYAEIAAWIGADVVLILSTVKHMRQIHQWEQQELSAK